MKEDEQSSGSLSWRERACGQPVWSRLRREVTEQSAEGTQLAELLAHAGKTTESCAPLGLLRQDHPLTDPATSEDVLLRAAVSYSKAVE